MIRKKHSIAALALALIMGLISIRPASALTVREVESDLVCQCGCTMVLISCDCSTSEQMRELIGKMIDEGKSKGQIVNFFVDQYGEDALAAPTKKGFNLTVWVLPFAAIAVGGAGIFFVLRAWIFKGRESAEEVALNMDSGEATGEYEQRFEQEFEHFKQEDDSR